MSLLNGATCDLWAFPADCGALRQVTNFGQRSTFITRRLSWSPDSKYMFAAVAETDADVILFDGLR